MSEENKHSAHRCVIVVDVMRNGGTPKQFSSKVSKMVQKWSEFENKIMEAVESEIRQGQLGLNPDLAKVYRHRSYFSRDRAKNIVTDISVEFHRAGAGFPFLVWVWECKDYSEKVPVNDVEEFHAKLEQIGVHKTKGTIVCPNGFQDGAIEYATSKGIGLARWLPDGSMIRLLESLRAPTTDDIRRGLSESNTQHLESMFYSLGTDGQGTMVFNKFIESELAELK